MCRIELGPLAVLILGIMGVADFCSPAFAQPPNPATASFNVSITLVKECDVSTAPTNINLGTFGSAGLISSGATGTTNFSVLCSSGVPYTIGFSSGNDLTVGSATHQMKGSGSNTDVVQYQLTDASVGAANTSPLSASSSVISGTGTGVPQSETVQAQVVNYTAAATPDTYADTMTLSVTY
jgi:spore coat protein U-like protein